MEVTGEKNKDGSANASPAAARPPDDGGSAFPEVFTDHSWTDDRETLKTDTYSAGGMTLRDYIAVRMYPYFMTFEMPEAARKAYIAADHLIAARAGG